MNWVFDTNAISALVHHRAGWERFARRIYGLTTHQRLISTITLSEFQTMIAKAGAPEAKRIVVWRVLLNFQLLDLDELAALHAGRIRAYLEPRGIRIGPMDTLLAAHALSICATVVTGNLREFARLPVRRFMECPPRCYAAPAQRRTMALMSHREPLLGKMQVPEPAGLALMALGLAGLGWSRRTR